MAFAQSHRPIEGAVATLGVSDRVTFLRRTYAHLGAALIAFAVITGGMMKFMPETSINFSSWAFNGFNWLIVIGLFMLVGYVAERLARSETSRAVQYLGLFIGVAAYGFIFQPILWVIFLRFGATGFESILTQGIVITLAIFVGLTATVFVTKKDFSFLRSALVIGSFAAIGIILAAILFGFSLGGFFAGAMILLMAGYILYQTSMVMRDFPPTGYVAASLMLFSTVATLFWYVLRLLMSLRE